MEHRVMSTELPISPGPTHIAHAARVPPAPQADGAERSDREAPGVVPGSAAALQTAWLFRSALPSIPGTSD